MKKFEEISNFFRKVFLFNPEPSEDKLRGWFLFAFLVLAGAIAFVVTSPFNIHLISAAFEFVIFPMSVSVLIGLLFFISWHLSKKTKNLFFILFSILFSIIAISVMLGWAQYRAYIGLYAIPILLAGFLITSSYSIIAALLSLLGYSITYLIALRNIVKYDFIIFLIVVVAGIIGWLLSKGVNETIKTVHKTTKTYETLIDQTPGVIYIKEFLPASRFTYISPQITNLLGITPQEWLSDLKLRQSFIHPEDKDRIMAANDVALTKGSDFKEEYRVRKKDGTVIWISDYAINQIVNGKVISQQGLMMDITERKKTEKIQSVIIKISEAVSSSKDLNELFKFIHQSMGELMPVDNFYFAIYEPDENLLYFPYFIDQVDTYNEPYPPGKGLTEYVMRTKKPLLASPDELQHLVEMGEVERIGAPSLDWLGVPLIVEDQTIGVMAVQTYKEGVRFSQLDLGVLNSVSSTVAMVIYRKRIEDKLQESEQMYRTLVGASPDVIIEMDVHGVIRYVSPPTMEIFHLASENQVVGTKFYDWVDTDDRIAIKKHFDNVIKKRQVTNFAFQFVDVDGGKLTGECNTGVLTDSENKITGLVTVMRDITDRKKAEDQLKEALKEKEVLLREVHHRVKNNLQIMSSLLSIQEEKIEDSTAKDALKNAQSRIRSMAYIHEDLYQTSHLAYVDLDLYLRKLVQNLLDLYSMGKQVTAVYDIDSSQVGLDTAIPCGLIVNELVSNSLKYAFPDKREGIISIRFYKVKNKNKINQFTLEVADNGIGIMDTWQLHEENSRKLGFQLVQILAKQLNGIVQIEKSQGVKISISFGIK